MKATTHIVNMPFLLQGLVATFGALLVIALIFSLIGYLSQWQASNFMLMLGNYCSIFIGALTVGRKLSQKIWINGALVGIIFLCLATLIKADTSVIMHWSWIKQILLVSVIGILGSLIGGATVSD